MILALCMLLGFALLLRLLYVKTGLVAKLRADLRAGPQRLTLPFLKTTLEGPITAGRRPARRYHFAWLGPVKLRSDDRAALAKGALYELILLPNLGLVWSIQPVASAHEA
ncbi:MAG TPA: hypothetical protein VGE07_22935 [Herpetosiphonaceae bacterium]